MKIALCYDSVIPAKGGCETYIADLLRRLVADGHQVHLYACRWDAHALPAQIVFHRIAARRSLRFLWPWQFASACAKALEAEEHDVVIGLVKTWKQDVLIPQGGLHLASAQYGIRKHRQPWLRLLARIGKWLSPSCWSFWLLERKQYLGPKLPIIVAPSRFVQQHLRRFYGIPPERIRVVHNAIDPSRLRIAGAGELREEHRRRLGLAPDDPVGLFVGHNYKLKGLETLLRALAQEPARRAKVLVCGGTGTRPYQRLAAKLRVADRVRFLGFCPDIRLAFLAADFLVHPSFYDPCSLVVLEALAFGLPVITTSCNGAAELLHPPEDGLVIPDPADASALARCIEQFCDPVRRLAAARAALRTARQWTFEDHYRCLLAILHEVAHKRAAA